MNNNFSNWLTILITAGVGILLIAWHNESNLFEWLVRALGILLLVPGCYVLFSSFNDLKTRQMGDGAERADAMVVRRRPATISLVVVSVVSIVFGVWMLLKPDFFVGFMIYLMAAVLLVYGLYQIIVAAYFVKPMVLPWYFYIIPVIFLVMGLAVFLTPLQKTVGVLTLIIGILLLAGALNAAVQRLTVAAMARKMRNDARVAAERDAAPDADRPTDSITRIGRNDG